VSSWSQCAAILSSPPFYSTWISLCRRHSAISSGKAREQENSIGGIEAIARFSLGKATTVPERQILERSF